MTWRIAILRSNVVIQRPPQAVRWDAQLDRLRINDLLPMKQEQRHFLIPRSRRIQPHVVHNA